MEAGYSEKVDELCERHSLEGFVKAKGKIFVVLLFFLLNVTWNLVRQNYSFEQLPSCSSWFNFAA